MSRGSTARSNTSISIPGLAPAEMVAVSEDVLDRNRHLLGPGEDYWLAQRISRGINRVPGDNWDHYGPNVIVECVPLPLRERAKQFRDGIEVDHPVRAPHAARTRCRRAPRCTNI